MGINEPNKYKLGAMILDLKDPTKVLYRSNSPILEPDEVYEKREHQGIVYSCGAVIKNKNLYVYYGGGDKFVCVASVSLQELVDSMKKDKIIKLKNTSSKNNIMKEAAAIFYDTYFIKNMDANKWLMCFNNGVIDFKQKEFRNGYPQDYITKSTRIDYIPYDKNSEEMSTI